MPIELTHKNVRDLAKNLREKAGRDDIKHSDVISAIAASVGRRPDAMMHELKNEKTNVQEPTASKSVEVSRPRLTAKALAAANGFGVWDTGGGCQAFGMVLREVETPNDDVATLEVLITTGMGCSVDAGPDEPVWQAGVSYMDPRGGDSVRITEETLTLDEAIAQALEYATQADLLWDENYDSDAIAEYVGGRRP
jgi:hypothetical protein